MTRPAVARYVHLSIIVPVVWCCSTQPVTTYAYLGTVQYLWHSFKCRRLLRSRNRERNTPRQMGKFHHSSSINACFVIWLHEPLFPSNHHLPSCRIFNLSIPQILSTDAHVIAGSCCALRWHDYSRSTDI